MKFKFLIIDLLLVISLSLVVIKFLNPIINTFYANISDYSVDNISATSVWCLGSNHTERRCRFTNLCYKKDTKDYVFLFDENISIKSGVPSNRHSPALLDLSSVRDHNQFYFNYLEIPFNVLKNNLSKVYGIETLKGKTLIMSRFKADNLMHYFHDDLIPLYFTLQEIGSKQMDYILFDDIYSQEFNEPFAKNTFESIFPKWLTTSAFNDNTIYCFEESFVGLSKSMTWYDYGFHIPQSPIPRRDEESALIANTIRRLTARLIPERKCINRFVVFISRKMNRKILNEKVLIDFIATKSKLSVIIIQDLNNNFEAIIRKVFCAQLLIGMHGSALILSMFLSPGSSLIELFPFAVNPNDFTPYKTLTELKEMRINYYYWRNRFINHTIPHKLYSKQFGGIQHLSHEEQRTIESTTEDVPKHLCCDDPYWLYRIYSDTIVDIDSFEPVLSEALDKSSLPLIVTKESIEPGVVMGLGCHSMTEKGQHYSTIVWQKPWNLDYIHNTESDVKYEVLVQEVPSVSAKVSLVVGNELSFQSEPNKTYNIWIRCKLSDTFGPYNTNPLICGNSD